MIARTALVLAMLGALTLAGPLLDHLSISDHSAEVDQARRMEDADRADEARRQFEDAVQYLCGPQSAWREVSNGVIQCMTRAGKPTTKVSVKE